MIILSKLADYGVIVASYLAADPERQMTAAALATEARLPRATVAKVLKALAHGGVVAGARGAAGGYRLARPATEISVAEVVAAIDGAIGLTTRTPWQRINHAVGAALGAVSLAEMVPAPGGAPRQSAALRETLTP